ncbi:MAG: hypothetical protein FWD13_03050 [Treponema sp.]|nr:hypothetical protein [Treponema sp.]
MNIAITIIVSIILFIVIVKRNKSKMKKNRTKAIYIIINIEKESENNDFILDFISEFKDEFNSYTRITSYDTTLEAIQEEERNIHQYGSNVKLVDWANNEEFKEKHKMIWDLLTKYSNDKNVNLNNRNCYIDIVTKQGISGIIIRIY